MNIITILSTLVILFLVFYTGKHSTIQLPDIDPTNATVAGGIAIAVFFLSTFYETYSRDIAVLCSNIPRKCEDKKQ
jgi:hypothetical protein